MITDAHLDELRKLFAQHGVMLAYLFGSQAEGRATPLSDIDFGVLFPAAVPREARFQRQLELMAECSHLFQRDDVDVVVLNEAPPLLLFDVARHGQVLYEDPVQRPAVDFAVYAFNRYVDTQPFRQIQNDYLAERLRERRAAYDAKS